MILELRNIDKFFDKKHVLNNLNLSVESGKALGLLGRNGAGKTTTIRILMNVIMSNGGEILVDGAPINYNKISFGYLPEERGLYPRKKIIDQLVYLSMLKGLSRKDAVKSNDYWLGRLGMSEYRNARLETLSKGNQQKIQLITAIAHNPDIIILDEPFSGLDPVNAMLLKEVVSEQISAGKVVIFSSHQMSYVEEFCENIAILNSSHIVLSGNIKQIKKSYPRNKLLITTSDVEKIKLDYAEKCSSIDNENILITLDSDSDAKNEMINIVTNYNIDAIKIYEPSLNDIFVEYTEKHI